MHYEGIFFRINLHIEVLAYLLMDRACGALRCAAYSLVPKQTQRDVSGAVHCNL